jgi:DNA ligase (NAD+)
MAVVVASRKFQNLEQLEELVILLSYNYNHGIPQEDFDGAPVSDGEYDAMYAYLKANNPKSKAFEGVTPGDSMETTKKGKTIPHKPPMTSIAKADGTPEERLKKYRDWMDRCAQSLDWEEPALTSDHFAQSWKRDGNAVRINYVKGKRVSAGTRPRNGINGTDISGHVQYIRGVPEQLKLPLTLSLNVEVECWKDDMAAINAERDAAGLEPYANSRNYTAGQLGRDDPEEIKNARLRATVHSISGLDHREKYYETEIECAEWANTELLPDANYVQVKPHNPFDLAKMEAEAPHLPYDVDGIVLKVNNIDEQEQLGHHGDDPIKEPRGALAWKFEEKTAVAENDHLEWNTSRTGRVVPTAVFVEEVELAETMVGRATCNNYGWAEDRGIGKGTKIRIKKAGKIIPNVVEVVADPVKKFAYPFDCPSCGKRLKINTSKSGARDLVCENDDCPARHIEGWVFYFQKLGAKGLGGSAMEKILGGGTCKELDHFYDLEVADLTRCGFSERQAILALATIWMVEPIKDNDKLLREIAKARKQKQKTHGWKFYASLGVPRSGESDGKALMEKYCGMEGIMEATEAELQEVPGIGPKTAQSIREFFDRNKAKVQRLLKRFELELPTVGKLTGITIVLTGKMPEGREQLQEQIEAQGGKVAKSVGRTTTYLAAGEDTGKTKTAAAEKLGVKVIDYTALKKLIG